jgi:hypothetical protein
MAVGLSVFAGFSDKVMATWNAGEPAREVTERFEVSVSFIYKTDVRRRWTGDTATGAQRCRWLTVRPLHRS